MKTDGLQAIRTSTAWSPDLLRSKVKKQICELGYRRDSKIISFRDEVRNVEMRERASHYMHNYPAKMIPHIPYYFLRNLPIGKDALIGDFFCGSGTVLVEASLAHYNSFGVDINPLSVLISKVKTTPLDDGLIEEYKEKILHKLDRSVCAPEPEFPNRDFWFTRASVRRLASLKESIDCTEMSAEYRRFFLLCFSSIIRSCSNADPRISPPVFSKTMRKLNADGRRVHVFPLFRDCVRRNRMRIKEFSKLTSKRTASVKQGDARCGNLGANIVDILITSPPYLDAQKYMRASKLELYWLGMRQTDYLMLDERSIGTEKTGITSSTSLKRFDIETIDEVVESVAKRDFERAFTLTKYLYDMKQFFQSGFNSLQKRGYMVLVIGNNKLAGRRIQLDEFLLRIANQIGFEHELTLIDTIKSRGFMTKRNKTAGTIDSERIMLMRKS